MLEDRATLDRFRAGDRATLASVYRAFSPEIAKLVSYGFSFRAGDEVHRFFGYRAPHEQQDAVQEVFIRAFSERGRIGYDGYSPYGAYLRGILKNLVIDDFRKRRAALKVFGGGGDVTGDDVEAAEAPGDSPEVEVHRAAVGRAVRTFVTGLPEREKRLVALRFTEGLPQQDVARRMRVGRATVRTLEERVRRKLRASLCDGGLLEQEPEPWVARAWRSLIPAALLLTCALGGVHA